MTRREQQALSQLREKHPSLIISDWGNVDARQGVPAGYTVVSAAEALAGNAVPALVGFDRYHDDYSRQDLGHHRSTVRSGYRPVTVWIRRA